MRINIIFDFDGVIIDSNSIKTEAFKNTVKCYGKEASDKLIAFHLANGGVSRFKKFEWFVKYVLLSKDRELVNELTFSFGKEVRKKLFECNFRTDLCNLKEDLQGTRWFIASGGLQVEIEDLLRRKSILDLFEGGVFGSPLSKEMILRNITREFRSTTPEAWILIGDSIYDYHCANQSQMIFIFATAWSECKDLINLSKTTQLISIKGIEELDLNYLNSLTS